MNAIQADASPTETILSRFAEYPIYYAPNPGNAGDSLIALATYELFSSLDLEYSVIGPAEIVPDNCVFVYGGGGNLVEGAGYGACASFIRKYHSRARHLILLPHTVTGHEELLSRLGDNVTLICRERTSYQHVDEHASSARVLIDHDLALRLPAEVVRSRPTSVISPGFPDDRWRAGPSVAVPALLKSLLIRGGLLSCRTNVLNCFRTDEESVRDSLPWNNVDLSEVFAYGVWSEGTTLATVRAMLACIDPVDVVRTDRLHIGIAAGLLGKKVLLHPNCYFKNRAVYEHSLVDRMSSVHWSAG